MMHMKRAKYSLNPDNITPNISLKKKRNIIISSYIVQIYVLINILNHKLKILENIIQYAKENTHTHTF
jgi:hypothetical protein